MLHDGWKTFLSGSLTAEFDDRRQPFFNPKLSFVSYSVCTLMQADNPDDHMIRPEEDGEDVRYDAVVDAQLRAEDAAAAAAGSGSAQDSTAMVDDGAEAAPVCV